MRIQFSDHALERMRSRNLTNDQIKEAIKNPDEQFHNQMGMVVHKILKHDESHDKFLLRVFYKDEEDTILIISAYKTTKIEKYWKGDFNED